MQVRNVETGFMIKLARGERVMETLGAFCEKYSIKSAVFSAIGAVKNTEIGYYNLEKREYFFKKIADEREVASMTGNVAMVDEKPLIHAHAVLSAMDETLSCIGAHIKEAEVAVTLEIFLTPFALPMTRAYDEETGLKLLQL